MASSDVGTYFHYISYSARRTTASGNKAETKWKLSGNAFLLYFLSARELEESREVLRLGLVGSNPGFSSSPLAAIQINARFEEPKLAATGQ
jgi:hypothetical protein